MHLSQFSFFWRKLAFSEGGGLKLPKIIYKVLDFVMKMFTFIRSLINSRDSIWNEKIKGFLKISTARSLITEHKKYL